jgi:hypothetical protein
MSGGAKSYTASKLALVVGYRVINAQIIEEKVSTC